MIDQCKKMPKKLILFFCVFLLYTVNTESHQYVDIEDYPYHVSIQIGRRHVCSGAFIHESWIITVASCVSKYTTDLSIVLVRVRTNQICPQCGNALEINNIVLHENFDKCKHLNDIALIKLKSPAEFGEKLLPIGLPEEQDEQVENGTRCVVTCYKSERNPAQLAATAVTIINQHTCKERMPSNKPLSEEMLCAVNDTRPAESCQGDLGAPLVLEQTLIGILSYGLGCETRTHPGVYTRISSYLSWIFANSGIYQ